MSVAGISLALMSSRGQANSGKKSSNFDRDAIKGQFRPHTVADNTDALKLTAGQLEVQALNFGSFARVLGGPLAGKTTALKALFLKLARQESPESLMVFTANRTAAATLRDELALSFQGASLGPMARTIPSLAFSILRNHALNTKSKLPELITGSEQDAMIEQLLEDIATQKIKSPDLPKNISKSSLQVRGVREELRNLISVAIEHDLEPAALETLAEAHGYPQWHWAAAVYRNYLELLAQEPHRFDPSSLIVEATKLIRASAASNVAAGSAPDAAGALRSVRTILVDDAQELTPAATDFLRAMTELGASVVMFGDPDVATLGFRSADPEAMTRLVSELATKAGKTATLITLEQRAGARSSELELALTHVTERLGAALGGPQRGRAVVAAVADGAQVVDDADQQPPIIAKVFSLQGDEHAWLAYQLRSEHLHNQVEWRDMAVVARSADELHELENALAAESVPVRIVGAKTALKDEFAAASVLQLLEVALTEEAIDYATAERIMLSPIGNFDSVELRRLRRSLRATELANSGTRNVRELVCAIFTEPDFLLDREGGIVQKAEIVARLFFDLKALAKESSTTIQDLLWLVYVRTRMQKDWPKQSLAVEEVALQVARNLDSVVALFAAASRFVERNPTGAAIDFVRAQLDLRLPEDSVGTSANLQHRVSLLTPSALIGRHFKVLAIAHLQEGIWPNLRPRSSLLGSVALDQILRASAGVADDSVVTSEMPGELRMLAKTVGAVSERLYLSAIDTEEEQGSQFIELLAHEMPEASEFESTPLTLRSIVGELRKRLIRESRPDVRVQLAAQLAKLSDAEVPGAHPSQWWGIAELSTTEQLAKLGVDAKDPNALKLWPSQLDNFMKCPLHWFITAHGGDEQNFKARVGDLMHEALERELGADPTPFREVINSKFDSLEFDSEWQKRAERRRVDKMTTRILDYLSSFSKAGNRVVGREVPFHFEIAGAHVSGRVDRIEILADKTIRISDLKTSRNPDSEAKANESLQLGVYQIALVENAYEKTPEIGPGAVLNGALQIQVGMKDGGDEAKLNNQSSFSNDLGAQTAMRATITQVVEQMLMPEATFTAKIGEHCNAKGAYGSCKLHLIEQITFGVDEQ